MVSQLEALRDHAASSGMKIIEEFTDEGYSGLRLDRPGLDRMRDLAEQRGFDVLLTCGADRLARNFALQVLILEELERCGVRTIFLDQGPADDCLWKLREITGAAAHFEQAQGTERARRDGPAAHAETQESEAVVVGKNFDGRSCFPACRTNSSVDALSPGSGQRDFHSCKQGVE
jgi:DNA invertase Pin-like site-specific DNA recombinase